MPHVPVWLGGPEASHRTRELMENYPELTGIMIGEGEQTFLELLSHYAGRTPGVPESVKGICCRISENNKLSRAGRDGEKTAILYTGEREAVDLSAIPFMYGQMDFGQLQHKIIYYESSRGCPFRCSYCLSSIDKKLRLRDITMVKRELQYFLDRRVKQVKFIDRTFNCCHKHAMEIWQYIKEHDNGITNFHFEIAADLLNETELQLLNSMRPGAIQMEIGVQTTNEKTLKEIRRVTDLEKIKKAVERLHDGRNIHIHLDLIAGLPYEDYESFQNSFRDVYRMKPEQLQLGFLKVLSGSFMKEKAEEYGLCYTDEPPYEVLCSKWIDFGEISRLKQIEEMVEIYYNSRQFTYTIPYLEGFFESAFGLYEALADFYERTGAFINTPSRISRYRVLLDFAGECAGGIDVSLLKELLTMDIYLREHAKSRPDFAKDIKPYKERIRCFYRMEAANRKNGTHILMNYSDSDPRMLARMLHLEPFSYDIFGDKPTYQRLEEEVFVLYDYEERDPLTYAAKIRLIRGVG